MALDRRMAVIATPASYVVGLLAHKSALHRGHIKRVPCDIYLVSAIFTYIRQEGSHSGLVRPPAKRLGGESSLMGSNPIPSATTYKEI